MRLRVRSFVSFAVALLFAGGALAKNLPNIDAFGSKKGNPNSHAEVARNLGALRRAGTPVHGEPRLNVPTFVWLTDNGKFRGRPQGQGAERREIAAARGHLNTLASAYGLNRKDVGDIVADAVLNTGRGPVIVKFKQTINGVEIFREELNLVMNQNLDAIAVTGYLTSQTTPDAQPGQGRWTMQASEAATAALRDAAIGSIGSQQLTKSFAREGYDFYTFSSAVPGVTLEEPVRVKPVYFHLPEGLVPAYYVEVVTNNATGDAMLDTEYDESAYAYVLSAVDGTILFRKNLVAQAEGAPQSNALPPGGFTYRVWADPTTGIPYDTPAGNGVHPKLVPLPDGAQHTFLPMQDVTLPNFPFSNNDPWLAPGATQTDGNNADAFINWYSPDGLGTPTTTSPTDPSNGDHRAQTTGVDQFLYTHQPDVDGSSVSARSASITQLFYDVNFLHDWFYDAGFNEVNRNGQKNNFGRGGLQNDDMKAQAQDFQSFSNANMLTPADGSRSRMRMYNFPNPANVLDVQSPAAVGKLRIGVSQTGTRAFDVTGNIVIATFTAGPSTCTITNAAALTGNIAMFDFDNTDGTGCSFSTRIARIHATGAAAALMVYSSAPASVNAVANITGIVAAHTKPIGVISWNSGQAIKAQLAVPNTVTARLLRMADRDGTLDNQIVFHEWGHFISNRLIGNAAGLNNNQGGSMGEGWGDFLSMLLTVRQDDTLTPSNANWGGVYALATYATSGVNYSGALNHGYYLGIRRTPYSTDMAQYNALTFKHIMDGVPMPSGPPIALSTAPNSEVHNAGEIWTTMLWECYASLLRDTLGPAPRLTFQQAQDRMKQYLVASFMMTPSSPTYLEARDAVLAAAYANDSVDYILFWKAFAKRGAGVYAVAPDRWSTNHSGVVESFEVAAEVTYSASLDDSVSSCDGDGSLDSGETGKLVITLKNVGVDSLSATTATITSSTPGVSFPAGNTINFPPSDPLATVNGAVTVAYASGIAGIQQIDFHIVVDDPKLSGPRTQDPGFRANVAFIPASSATDTVEGTNAVWTLDSDATLSQVNPWTRAIVVPLDREWHVDNAGSPSDQRLVSPIFTASAAGSVNLQFDHSWSFEAPNFDGGVIELQVNGGAWTDIGGPAYNGTITNYTGDLNPLKTRPGFVGSGSGHVSLTQAIAPGSTVRIRFRFGSDNAAGAPGWNVDNIAFTGVVETPFDTTVADPGCVITTSTATSLTPSANPSPFGSPLTLTATVTSVAGTPTGNVTFYDSSTSLGTVALTSGVATLTTSSLSVGAHTLSASYAGDPGFLPSTSGSLAETISKVATSVALISSANPSNGCSSVTFTATVTATSGTPTGSITFTDGATTLGTVSLSSGVATITAAALTSGSHTITAAYAGTSTFASSSNSITQTVNTPPSTPTITPGGPTTFCEGGSVTLTSSSAAGNQWYLNGSPIGGATNQTFVADAAGDYTVVVTIDGCVSPASAPATVVENPIPSTPTITPSGPTTFCEGGSVTLTSSSASGNQWYRDGNPIGGATSQTYDAPASGNYTVIVTTSGCPSAASAATSVVVNPIPATPTITPGGPTTFCEGGSVTLTSSSASGNQWYLDGNPIGGATNQTYDATISGNYTVIVTTSGCSSAASAATGVVVNPIPATPTINASGPTTFCAGGSVTLTSSSASGNQWFLNGSPLGGATNQTFVASTAGDYTVVVTTTGCSSAASAATTVTVNPLANATITTAASVVTGSTGNTASVADPGAGTTFNWSITGGTITAGTGTANITYTAGAVGTLTLQVTVTRTGGCSDTQSANVTVTPVPPAVTVDSVTPNTAPFNGGKTITITGTGFKAGASVTIGGTAATNVVVVSATQITCTTPAHAPGTVDVVVTNLDATTGTLINGLTITPQAFDPNGDGNIDPSDIFYLVNYLFSSGPAPAGTAGMASGDANGDGSVDPADIFYVVNYLYLGGPVPSISTPRVAATAVDASFGGAITLGAPTHRGGRTFVPVMVETAAGSDAPQAIALKVRVEPAIALSITRAGRAKALQPAFEISRPGAGELSYLVAFDPRNALTVEGRTVIAEIEVSSRTGAKLELDPQVTLLADAGGVRKATVAAGTLRLEGVVVQEREVPRGADHRGGIE